jgi:hypothetical protein
MRSQHSGRIIVCFIIVSRLSNVSPIRLRKKGHLMLWECLYHASRCESHHTSKGFNTATRVRVGRIGSGRGGHKRPGIDIDAVVRAESFGLCVEVWRIIVPVAASVIVLGCGVDEIYPWQLLIANSSSNSIVNNFIVLFCDSLRLEFRRCGGAASKKYDRWNRSLWRNSSPITRPSPITSPITE